MELSSELAELGRDDGECLFRLGLVFASPAVPQTSERHWLTISASEVVHRDDKEFLLQLERTIFSRRRRAKA